MPKLRLAALRGTFIAGVFFQQVFLFGVLISISVVSLAFQIIFYHFTCYIFVYWSYCSKEALDDYRDNLIFQDYCHQATFYPLITLDKPHQYLRIYWF